jgi:hypothetical protein
LASGRQINSILARSSLGLCGPFSQCAASMKEVIPTRALMLNKMLSIPTFRLEDLTKESKPCDPPGKAVSCSHRLIHLSLADSGTCVHVGELNEGASTWLTRRRVSIPTLEEDNASHVARTASADDFLPHVYRPDACLFGGGEGGSNVAKGEGQGLVARDYSCDRVLQAICRLPWL